VLLELVKGEEKSFIESVKSPTGQQLPAADAAHLPSLGMILVLDQGKRGGGGVSLYSGKTFRF